jgi:YQGE family putative transporter
MISIIQVFKDHKERLGIFNTNALKFITSNFFFGLFNPFYAIFSNTFIFNITKGNLEMNLVYSMFTFIGIILGFYITGIASKKIHIQILLLAGVWLLFLSIVIMFSMPVNKLNFETLLLIGLFTGIGSGVYWAARNYLTLILTDDTNRDFFSGIDYILISSGRIITPLIVGIYIGAGIKFGWFTPSFAYRSVLVVAFILTVLTTIISFRVKTRVYLTENIFKIAFTKQWSNIRYLMVVTGFFQGAYFVVPSVFIMKFVGGEGTVGTINSIGYIVAIFIVYIISSRSGIEHRTSIIRLGLFMFLAGAIVFLALLRFNPYTGTYALIFLMLLTEPILNFPIRATLLNAVDIEKEYKMTNGYAHFVDVELFAAIGRIACMIFFYILYMSIPSNFSLPLFILLISLIQFLTIPLSRRINSNRDAG